MKITVIIPTLNESSTIVRTLPHTVGLGFHEIIVVDGGSSDQTQQLVTALRVTSHEPTLDPHQAPPTRHPSPVTLLSSPHGRARQLNAGAKASRGDVLLFLHADTRLPDIAKQAIESALVDPAVVGGRFDVRFDSRSAWATMISAFMNSRSRLTRISTGDQAIFVRRDMFERLGGFSDIPIMEDIEFSLRLKRSGPITARRETVTTSFRRWEKNGPLKTILLMWALRFLYWIGVSPHRLANFYAAVR